MADYKLTRFRDAVPGMAFASSAGKLFTSTRASSAWRCETRQMSNLILAKGSIATLFQAKGRTDEALAEAAAMLARKKVAPLALKPPGIFFIVRLFFLSTEKI
jgi:hypothetical protein